MIINPVLLVIDMQNGFCGIGGSFDQFGFNIEPYRAIIPNVRKVIDYVRKKGIPIFYAKAIREPSGIDLLDRVHRILPESRREKLEKMHLCIRDTWDSEIVDEIMPGPEDYVIEKRRDSAFQDTQLELWLKSVGADTIFFAGIDTYICVESSVRSAFNLGYDVILLSDCVASRVPRLHETSIECVRESYGWVLTSDELIGMIENRELIITTLEEAYYIS